MTSDFGPGCLGNELLIYYFCVPYDQGIRRPDGFLPAEQIKT